jgi:hypothetical protein
MWTVKEIEQKQLDAYVLSNWLLLCQPASETGEYQEYLYLQP